MSIKDKLKTMTLNEDNSRTIQFNNIDWIILDDDLFCIYNTKNDYSNNTPSIKCKLKDINLIDKSLLDKSFDIFGLYKPNPIYNQLCIYFILESEPIVEKGIDNKIKYIN